jgi:hypothetical protein
MHMPQSLETGASDGAFKPACGKLNYPCASSAARNAALASAMLSAMPPLGRPPASFSGPYEDQAIAEIEAVKLVAEFENVEDEEEPWLVQRPSDVETRGRRFNGLPQATLNRKGPDVRERKVKLEVYIGRDDQGRWWVIASIGNDLPTRPMLQRLLLIHRDSMGCDRGARLSGLWIPLHRAARLPCRPARRLGPVEVFSAGRWPAEKSRLGAARARRSNSEKAVWIYLGFACGYKLANDGQDTRMVQHTVRYTELPPEG